MTAPITTPSEAGGPGQEFFAALERLHGHRCPMSILGARLGLAARAALGEWQQSERRLRARFHHRTCALDGVQLATQCTLGNGNIEVLPEGEHRLELTVTGDPRHAEAVLRPEGLERGRRYGGLRTRAEELPPESEERRTMETQMMAILTDLETAPAEELVVVTLSSD
jgi:formylmethanofuran dehydrogenase subunit E